MHSKNIEGEIVIEDWYLELHFINGHKVEKEMLSWNLY